MITLQDAIDQHGIDVDPHLDRAATIPVCSGVTRQGDIIVVPKTVTATTPVPSAGTAVVRGEAGGNTHAVVADGPVFCDVKQATAQSLVLAYVLVPDGSVAYLAHPEHAYTGLAPGSYEIRRQREQADELRLVAD